MKFEKITVMRIGEREFTVGVGEVLYTAVNGDEVLTIIDSELENLDYE